MSLYNNLHDNNCTFQLRTVPGFRVVDNEIWLSAYGQYVSVIAAACRTAMEVSRQLFVFGALP